MRRIQMEQANNAERLAEDLRALPKFLACRIAGDIIEIEFEDDADVQQVQALRDVVTNHNPASLSLNQQEIEFLKNLPGDELTWTQAQVRRVLKGLLKRALTGQL